MTNEQQLDAFQQAIAPWLDCYQRIDTVYLAGKSPSGNILRHCRVILNPGIFPSTFEQFRHESESIILGSVTEDFSREWLTGLYRSAKPLAIGTDEIHFVLDTNQTENYYFNRSSALGVMAAPMRIPGLQISGGSLGKRLPEIDLDTLNWELRSAIPPYDDINELLSIVDIRRDVFSISSPVINIIALSPAMIATTSSMNTGVAHLRLLASGKMDCSKISLSCKTLKKGKVARKSVSLADCKWISNSNHLEGLVSVDCDDGETAHFFLKYEGRAIHHWWLRDPAKYINPYMAAYECYDADSVILTKMLFNPRDDSIAFEVGVAILLNTLGFGTSHFGIQENLQKGPDIIAVIPGIDAMLVIECTTGLLDHKDKLAKLIQRTQALKDRFAALGYATTTILPVIVSALARNQLAAHFNAAHEHQVSVVAKEELQQWCNNLRHLALNPKFVFDQFPGLVPQATAVRVVPIED